MRKKKLINLQSEIKNKYENIFIIVSPPRCASTAVARFMWNFDEVKYYCHEPFESIYYEHQDLGDVFRKLKNPINVNPSKSSNSIVIKEMPYQVGDNFDLLIRLSTKPILFLIRDPRLNVWSRIQRKNEVGDSIQFPLIETGWDLLCKQIDYCEKNHIYYIILDTDDFRRDPTIFGKRLCEVFDQNYSSEMIKWEPRPDIYLDNLGGRHEHLYRKVLSSEGVLPANEKVPEINDFPNDWGLRDHVIRSMKKYKILKDNRLRA